MGSVTISRMDANRIARAVASLQRSLLDDEVEAHTLGETACERAGLPRYAVHVLRHTWATVGAQLELPTVSVAPALGHTVEWQTTTYQHLAVEHVRRASTRIADELRKAVGA